MLMTTLTCPSCGGKLQISQNINRFACGYCGNEQIVHRESGIVYLEPIAEDVRHIRAGVEGMRGGVDKTAAELAIVRLTKEIGDLETNLKNAKNQNVFYWKPRSNYEYGTIVLSILLLTILVNTHSPIVWIIFLCCVCAFVCFSTKRDADARKIKNKMIDKIEARIVETKAALRRNRQLV